MFFLPTLLQGFSASSFYTGCGTRQPVSLSNGSAIE